MSKSLQLKHILWYISLFFLTLSGFAQMPIFKRYYLADLPGLGWLDQFYVTHFIHYLFAPVFIGYITFAILDYFLTRKSFIICILRKNIIIMTIFIILFIIINNIIISLLR